MSSSNQLLDKTKVACEFPGSRRTQLGHGHSDTGFYHGLQNHSLLLTYKTTYSQLYSSLPPENLSCLSVLISVASVTYCCTPL